MTAVACKARVGYALWRALVLLALVTVSSGTAAAELARFLPEHAASSLVAGADGYGELEGEPEGDPPVVAVLSQGEVAGYVFLNSDHVTAIGYSGRPIHILVALDPDGVIIGARLVEHHEPIVLVGIPEARMVEVTERYRGVDVTELVGDTPAQHDIDIISGATVTIMVMDDSILRSAIKVARRLGLGGLTQPVATQSAPATLRDDVDDVLDWTDLIAERSASRLKVSVDAINLAFAASDDEEAAARPESGPGDDAFVDLYAALVSVPSVGRSLLGEAEYANLRDSLAEGQHAVLLAGSGRFSFKGSGYVRGGLFDRFQLIAADRSLRFRDLDHERLRIVAAQGAPKFREVDLFRIPSDFQFDPTAPFRIELLVSRETGARTKAFLTFNLDYALNERYVDRPAPVANIASTTPTTAGDAGPPLWHRLWRQKRVEVIAVLVAIGVLSLVFFSQDWLARRPRLLDAVRIGLLMFTAFGIGLYANAQLSVVNILTVVNAMTTGFDWSYFLMEPLIFVLWGSVAVALVLWGRGAYCGWLCPFGALQELSNRLARACKVPQWRVPWALHERLWALKYVIFLVIFGVSLHSLALAERLAEIEPFKTVVVLKFAREWPYVVFAAALLVAGLFVERFFCRYLCPLGAALAIPARLSTFRWLKRYRQCGSPCQRCANDCMVQAIHPEGHIEPNECHQCLGCQVLYHDERRCPVAIARREKRDRRNQRASPDSALRVEAILTEIRAGRAAKPQSQSQV